MNVYPEPDPTNSTPVTEPLVTVAFSVAWVEPVFVGDSIWTTGGFVSLYPLPPSSRVTFLIPFTNADAAPPDPVVVLIETFGGYSNL